MVEVKGILFGGQDVPLIAGPCSIESQSQFSSITEALSKMSNVALLRGGIYKMRSNPESFQGLGKEALPLVKDAKNKTGFSFTTEVTDPRQVQDLYDYADIFQVGTRSMYNYELLKELGKAKKPVLLKRAFSATYGELLSAAEYVIKSGNENVLLCERGIRTFVNDTRNTFDINAIPYLKEKSHLPVLADPSHGTGIAKLVGPVALAALAAGADGLLIEIHNNPKEALSDGPQALTPEELQKFIPQANTVLGALGRKLYERT